MDQSKSILIYFLDYLHQKNIPLDKITIQKGLFFLKEMGLPIKFRFEPYIYGPFSIDLAMELDEMVFWDELAQSGSRYKIKKIDSTNFSEQIKEKINDKLNCLEKILDEKFDFNNLELASTVLFVIRSLEASNEKIDMESVVKEVRDWKGNKFGEDDIISVYKRLNELARKEKCLTIGSI